MGDGRFGPSQWDHSTGAGHWQPLLDATPDADPRPHAVGRRRAPVPDDELLAVPDRRPERAHAAPLREGLQRGQGARRNGTRADPSARTPEQTHNATFWQSAGGPALLWNDVARDLVEAPGYGVDIATAPSCSAMLNLAGADAAINCWNDKYHFDFWRPWQAIREAADGRQPQDRRLTPLGRRSSRPHTPSTHRGTCASTARTSTCCGRSSARTRSRSASRAASSVARRASSAGSRNLSRRSSRLASGRVCTSAPLMCRRQTSARTSPSTWRRTTSSRSADAEAPRRRSIELARAGAGSMCASKRVTEPVTASSDGFQPCAAPSPLDPPSTLLVRTPVPAGNLRDVRPDELERRLPSTSTPRAGSPRRAAPRPHAPRLQASRPDRRVLELPQTAAFSPSC